MPPQQLCKTLLRLIDRAGSAMSIGRFLGFGKGGTPPFPHDFGTKSIMGYGLIISRDYTAYMGNSIICHFRKLKTGSDMANVSAHNSRAKIYEDGKLKKRPKYLSKNEPWPPVWIKPGAIPNEGVVFENGASIGAKWAKLIKEAKLKRKPQKNASRAFEAILTASDGSFSSVTQWKNFLKEYRNEIIIKYGKENLLQWNFHFDEKTPHAHIIFIPILRGEKNKFSSDLFLGGPAGLRELQNFVGEFGNKYGLERGQENSENKHTNLEEWKKELKGKEKKLQVFRKEVMAELKEKDIAITAREEKLEVTKKEWIDVLEKKEKELTKKEDALIKRENGLEEKALNMAKEFLSRFYAKIENLQDGKRLVDWIKTFAVQKFGKDQTAKKTISNKLTTGKKI